jgi:acetyl esterase/lipase
VPSDITLGGDSAGAGITLSLVSFLSHTSSDFPIVKADQKLKAVIVVARWVSFLEDWPSYKRNEFKNRIAVERFKKCSAAYRGGKPTNNYIEAIEAPANWWQGVQVDQLLCAQLVEMRFCSIQYRSGPTNTK